MIIVLYSFDNFSGSYFDNIDDMSKRLYQSIYIPIYVSISFYIQIMLSMTNVHIPGVMMAVVPMLKIAERCIIANISACTKT